MSVFRSPLYLNTEILVPLANYHDIEVMTDIAVSQRDLGARSGKAAVNVSIPVPGAPGVEVGGSKGSETEVTQDRVVRAHPANALNRVLDTLAQEDDLTRGFTGTEAVMRHQLVEIDRDWEVSPATDIGSMLTSMMAAFSENPAVMEEEEAPPELIASMMGSRPTRGQVVLDASVDDDQSPRVLVLLDSDYLVGQTTLDDLAEDRTVFGQVDTFTPAGSEYSLEKFFLSGFGRAIRRAISVEEMIAGLGPMLGRPTTRADLVVGGPVVVVKAIGIY